MEPIFHLNHGYGCSFGQKLSMPGQRCTTLKNVNILSMVQVRLFCKIHPDAHYAAALFRYQQELAILLRDLIVAELYDIVTSQDLPMKPIMFMYTDGGLDNMNILIRFMRFTRAYVLDKQVLKQAFLLQFLLKLVKAQ